MTRPCPHRKVVVEIETHYALLFGDTPIYETETDTAYCARCGAAVPRDPQPARLDGGAA